MMNAWESTVTLGNAALWSATLITGFAAAYSLFWATCWALLAVETLLALITIS